MKTRNGFVSNSSSSSFVIIGYKLSDDFGREEFVKERYPKEYQKLVEEAKEKNYAIVDYLWDFIYDHKDDNEFATYLSDDGPGFMGKIIAEYDDYCLGSANLMQAELEVIMAKVQEACGFDYPPSLIVGERST